MSEPKKRFGRSRKSQDDAQDFALTERDRELAALAAEILPRNSAAASFERSAARRSGSSAVSAEDAATDHDLADDAAAPGTADASDEAGSTDEPGVGTSDTSEDAETPAARKRRQRDDRRRAAKAAKAEKRERRSTDYQPTPLWYKVVMIGLMILGLLWIITYYLFQGMVPIPGISVWNLVIGLGFMLAGLIMTTRWR
ncbi:cell division protein CrgA [Kocuria marina]|uniref:cell division protein CrgA n=1 Tax=Kocuria marina TaxID=223184 RepID=UPI0011A0A644|nr:MULTISPECIES: cell division protein CrgA [Kocuria]MCT2019840.1 cell division protein CrgA [Kocuria marina]